MEIILEQPNWLLLLCAGIAALMAFLLYRKDRLNRHLSFGVRAFLGVLRFVALFLLSIFLLHPLIKTISRETEAATIVIVQDNSESVVLGKDSAYYKSEWPAKVDALVNQLGEAYTVERYTFGDQLSEEYALDYSAKNTDLSIMLDGVYNRYSQRNVGAVIVASDGIFNTGSDPLFASRSLDAPIYTLALGDTTERKDVRIADVASNSIAYLGNRFPIEIAVESKKAKGEEIKVSILHKGRNVWEERITISKDYQLDTRKAILEAEKEGLQRYIIRVSTLDGEVTAENNVQDVYVDVLETRQKILILAAQPHPDVAALRSAISGNQNYEVQAEIASEYDGNLDENTLIILHQIPSVSGAGDDLLREALQKEIPLWFCLGTQSSFSEFNSLQTGFALEGFNGNLTDAGGTLLKSFPYFQIGEEQRQMMRELPPLAVPFGNFRATEGAVSLINQRVGTIETNTPILAFNRMNSTKIAMLYGEGMWRWRMVSYLRSGKHEVFDKLISSSVQYLASREDKRQFKVNAPRELLENEKALFTAELYNDAYESITSSEVELVLTSDQGDEYTFTFGVQGSFYRLDAGLLPVGDYTWEARTTLSGRPATQRGSLSVKPIQLESSTLVANHRLLYQLARENGGAMLYPSQVDELPGLIADSGDAVTISYERKSLSDLINLPWILAILLMLLSVEWLIRKRSGSY